MKHLFAIILLCFSLMSAHVSADTCKGVVVGASNSHRPASPNIIEEEHQHRLIDALSTLSALPGFRCKWYSFVSNEAPWVQIKNSVDALEDFDVLVVDTTSLLLRYSSGFDFASDLASTYPIVRQTPHIVLIKYQTWGSFLWTGPVTNPAANIDEYNATIENWNIISVDYPKYITGADGLHATEKALYGMAAEIYARLIENGF